MSFSYPTITHAFQNGGSVAAAGAVEWSLLGWMTNGSTMIAGPAITSVNLDSDGNMSTDAVASNLDPGTEPAFPWNSSYRVDIQILGAQALSFEVVVPPIQTETNGSIVSGALNSVVLSSLTAAQYMYGQSITGTGIPSDTVITAIDTSNNSLTISNNATEGSDLTLVLGTTIELGYLLPTVPQPL